MSHLDAASTMAYVLDMLGQLTRLAARAGLHGLAARIEILLAAERATGMKSAPTARDASKD